MTEPGPAIRPLIFTDLDGSLLDHHNYSFVPAATLLAQLRALGIPVMPCTSKTRAEVEPLRAQLHNNDPFVVENGAAICIPKSSVAGQPIDSRDAGELWLIEQSQSRAHWLEILSKLRQDFEGDYQTFFDAGSDGIAAMTGLAPADAARANQRQYSEPVQWLGSDARKAEFVARLQALGATVLQGGRFLSVSGDCDKGRALQRIQAVYARQSPAIPVVSLAIGDSHNDVAMLEAADHALIIRSPVHQPPALQRQTGVTLSRDTGPEGWRDGVQDWLYRQGFHLQHITP